MKMYKKSELTIIDGMLVSKGGDVISVDPMIVSQANKLETMVQQGMYLIAQPEETPAPSLDGFERKSDNDIEDSKFSVNTPILDAKAEETMALMDELDDMTVANKANDMLEEFKELILFAKADYVIDHGNGVVLRFDTPVIGSVLELTVEDITKAVALVNGMTEAMPFEKHVLHSSDLDAEDIEALLGIISKYDEGVIDPDSIKLVDHDGEDKTEADED